MTTNDTTGLKSELSIQYMYDNAYYNELYNALPEFRYGISNIQSFWNVNQMYPFQRVIMKIDLQR